jgi:hypothetical protein
MTDKCACADLPFAGKVNPEEEWPAPHCDGVMRVYPSGTRACECGEHIVRPGAKRYVATHKAEIANNPAIYDSNTGLYCFLPTLEDAERIADKCNKEGEEYAARYVWI